MIRILLSFTMLTGLSACATTQMASVQPLDGVISGQCHVDTVRGAVGLSAGGNTVERARVDSDSNHVRVIGARGQAAAAVESGGDRLTIETGRSNRITAIYCG